MCLFVFFSSLFVCWLVGFFFLFFRFWKVPIEYFFLFGFHTTSRIVCVCVCVRVDSRACVYWNFKFDFFFVLCYSFSLYWKLSSDQQFFFTFSPSLHSLRHTLTSSLSSLSLSLSHSVCMWTLLVFSMPCICLAFEITFSLQCSTVLLRIRAIPHTYECAMVLLVLLWCSVFVVVVWDFLPFRSKHSLTLAMAPAYHNSLRSNYYCCRCHWGLALVTMYERRSVSRQQQSQTRNFFFTFVRLLYWCCAMAARRSIFYMPHAFFCRFKISGKIVSQHNRVYNASDW